MIRNQIADLPFLSEYISTISENHCPYISKSIKNNSLFFSVFEFEKTEKCEELFFYLALLFTECFRKERQKNRDVFYCENIIIKISDLDFIEQELFLTWVHSNLKALYTEKSILFGKFWPSEKSKNQKGKDILPPPYIILSIRSKVSNIDQRFFIKSKNLLEEFFTSIDDGRNVLNPDDEYSTQLIEELSFDTETSESVLMKSNLLLNTGIFNKTIGEKTIIKFGS